MDTMYVVMRMAWEYNDEFFSRPIELGGSALVAFRKFQDAHDFMTKENINEVKEILHSNPNEIEEYTNEDDILNLLSPEKRWGNPLPAEDYNRVSAYFDILNDKNKPTGISPNMSSKIPDKDWVLLGKHLGFDSHYLEEVPVK